MVARENGGVVGMVWEAGEGKGGRRWEFLKGSRGISGTNAEKFLINKALREEANKGGQEPGWHGSLKVWTPCRELTLHT